MKDVRNLYYRFDSVEIDVQNLRLTVGSEIRAVEPKSFRLLLFLIENRGRALTKDEIMAAVWPATAVSDNSLARAITQIRKALDDDPKAPRFIETVPTVGYRFVGDVRPEVKQEASEVAPELVQPESAPLVPRQPVPGERRPFQWSVLATAAVATALLTGGAAWWIRGSPVAKLTTFVRLTDQPGQEVSPTLAPDGRSFIYASRISGNWDIYSQRVGGKNAVNLTPDSAADDTEPVLSPDGERIAFRSEREGGGIFVMGASGENTKRVTDFGHDPAWSPDGREIVFAVTVGEPISRLSAESQLFSVNIATGEKHPLTSRTGNAFQPHWSPHGYRVAYWAQVEGVSDVWTIPARGGDAVRVTKNAAVNWDPVWSPDGASLYFVSNRGGSMNLWRVSIDEKSGKVLGEIEPLTTPATDASHIAFSRSGKHLAYVQRTLTPNIWRVAFDSQREVTVGQPMPVTQGSFGAAGTAISPDGEWIAFIGGSEDKDEIFVARKDGSGLRQLTEDAYIDRRPMWSPDGKRIAFHSNRGGKFEIWTVRADGSDLQQVTHTQKSITHAVFSPDGKRMVYSLMNGTPSIMESDKPWSGQSIQALPPLRESGTWFEVAHWSPDGRKLAGFQVRADGIMNGIGIYSLETGQYTRITEFGDDPYWLKDSRRLIFTHGIPRDSAIYLVDSQSQKSHQILSVAPNLVSVSAVSPDDRWIYLSVIAVESDIWLADLQ
jgi:Tol biopolymer transport system component/DNA-binding winged helix-turn-helix (wHTH) protein